MIIVDLTESTTKVDSYIILLIIYLMYNCNTAEPSFEVCGAKLQVSFCKFVQIWVTKK